MHWHNEQILQHTVPITAVDPIDSINANTISHSELANEFGPPVGGYYNSFIGSQLLSDGMSFDKNLWPSTREGNLPNEIPQSEVTADAGQFQPEWMDESAEYHDPTNPTLTTGTATTLQGVPPESVNSDAHMAPVIHSEPFQCSWHSHDSGARCHHVESNKAAFLRHLRKVHKVSGSQNGEVTCRLYDRDTTSVCCTQIKGGSFPRHVERHYRVRYECQRCPEGKSFSRRDTWKKHLKNEHA